MQHNIAKHGFSYCGIIYLASGDERLAYQRIEVNTYEGEDVYDHGVSYNIFAVFRKNKTYSNR